MPATAKPGDEMSDSVSDEVAKVHRGRRGKLVIESGHWSGLVVVPLLMVMMVMVLMAVVVT